MLIEGVTVDYTIDGWPAAFSQECGEGRLHVTTLGLDGWVRPRTEQDDAPRQERLGKLISSPAMLWNSSPRRSFSHDRDHNSIRWCWKISLGR